MIGFEPGFEARVVADEVRFNIPDYLLQAALDASYAAKDHTHPVSQITGLEGALTNYLTKTDASNTYETKVHNWVGSDEIEDATARFPWIDTAGGKFRASWYGLRSKLKAFFDGIYQPKGNYQPSGSYATQASVDAKLPITNGRADGLGTNGDFSQYSDGQTALWFRTASGGEKTVIWTNGAGTNLNIRVNGKTSYFNTNGDIQVSGWVYAGNGSSRLEANGNVIGSIWGNYGYGTDAYTAITNRIEQRAREFADDRIGQVWWRCRDYLLGEHVPVGGTAFLKCVSSNSVGPGDSVVGSLLYWSNAGNQNGGAVNYGTWQCLGYTLNNHSNRTTLWKRIG
ncbi:hypothetical protein [Brucella pseudogrignonensis]|uniref:hypothetical protein n=1 Tax=Brucella pseudogrignonensis TaxID=419475 RepID=UPI000CFB1338|nr:hypothetical protein [Brucella pseudogrignonensis]MQP38756.1 hypothetical protein [Ochrobactrum sp. MYb237]PQZ43373.1 hypothetical protein CQ059_05430 [Brucella pseudogrignonensis]PRA43120.1 hypothetical protein CQ063_01915 [Brucella pseudogrignonensis]PRA72410.1 hypothetical protein CQ055_03665 [Brucella pseudogrignonensis]